MAKASEKDIEAAGNLMSLLDSVSDGYFPNLAQDVESPDRFDPENKWHLRTFYDQVMDTLRAAPGYPGRVIGGMCYVIMWDKNEIIDPSADVLELHPRIVTAMAGISDMEARKDAAYLERNQVVAALAKAFPSGVKRTAIEGWSEDWHGCVYIDLPTGQASWHFHDSQAYLFASLPAYQGEWDGHDTPEKYRRLAALTNSGLK